MANIGKKFTAQGFYLNLGGGEILDQNYFKYGEFNTVEVCSDWIVTFNREPRVIWVPTYDDGSVRPNHFKTQNEARLYGKPIKFIEVLEE